MSPNDPYVISDSTEGNEITVIVNLSHPYFATQLGGLENRARLSSPVHLRFSCGMAGTCKNFAD